MQQLQLPKDFIIISWIPYYAKIKGTPKEPLPIAKATSAEQAVREFLSMRYCPRGSVIQVFTPETLKTGKAIEHRLKEYRRPPRHCVR
jgi:hypothetical protein